MPVNGINPAQAANAYQSSQSVAKGGGIGAENGKSFGEVMRTTTSNAMDTIREGEKVAAQAVVGDADLTDVIQAINDAEMTLQTVVAVRDRMISAYQEIMRMPI